MGITSIPPGTPTDLPPQEIVNYCSDGNVYVAIDTHVGKKILSGSLTADTYKTVLTVNGRGVILFCAVQTEDSASRSVGLRVTIDGVDVFDATSSTFAGASQGLVAIGYELENVGNFGAQTRVPFNSSFQVAIKSSLSETDKVSAIVNYYTV